MSKVKLGTKYFESSLIAVLEAEGKNKTKIWMQGGSPVDGAFLISLPIDEVIAALRLARYQEVAEDLARASDSAEDQEQEAAQRA
jgi:hypothetical protein